MPAQWMKREGIPGIEGVDTRELTKKLRVHGVMLGTLKIYEEEEEPDLSKLSVKAFKVQDPNDRNLVGEVSVKKPIIKAEIARLKKARKNILAHKAKMMKELKKLVKSYNDHVKKRNKTFIISVAVAVVSSALAAAGGAGASLLGRALASRFLSSAVGRGLTTIMEMAGQTTGSALGARLTLTFFKAAGFTVGRSYGRIVANVRHKKRSVNKRFK